MVTALKETVSIETMLAELDVYAGTGGDLAIMASDKGALDVFEEMVFTCAICDCQLDEPRAVLCTDCLNSEGL